MFGPSSSISWYPTTMAPKVAQMNCSDRPTERPTERRKDRPKDRTTERPNNRTTERPNGRPNDRTTERPSERPHDRPNDRPIRALSGNIINLRIRIRIGNRCFLFWTCRGHGDHILAPWSRPQFLATRNPHDATVVLQYKPYHVWRSLRRTTPLNLLILLELPPYVARVKSHEPNDRPNDRTVAFSWAIWYHLTGTCANLIPYGSPVPKCTHKQTCYICATWYHMGA